MNQSYIHQEIRIPIRLESSADQSDLTGLTVSNILVDFAFESDTAFASLTKTTQFTLEELSLGQYFLKINASLNIKAENYQLVVRGDSCATVARKEYSGTVVLPEGKVKYELPFTITERSGVTSGKITRSGYPNYGVIFITSTCPTPAEDNFDIRLLEGALIHNVDELSAGQERHFVILGGYYFDDADSDKTKKVFGIALEKAFGCREGQTTIVDTNWTGSDLAEAGDGSGWTFIVAPKASDTQFPTSGQELEIYLNASFQRKASLETRFPDGAVYCHYEGDDTGTEYPLGERTHPTKLLSDALAIANDNGLKVIRLLSDIIVTGSENVSGKRIEGVTGEPTGSGDGKRARFTMQNRNTDGATFVNLWIYGDQTVASQKRLFIDCEIEDSAVDPDEDEFVRCLLKGGGTGADGGSVWRDCEFFHDPTSGGYIFAGDIDFIQIINCKGSIQIAPTASGGQRFDILGFNGIVQISNMQGHIQCLFANINGYLHFTAGVTNGSWYIHGGQGTLTDLKTGGTVLSNTFFDPTATEVNSNIKKVNGVAVTNIDDFKADVSGLSTFNPSTDEVDIGWVKGVAVAGVDDFKADVSGLSTFDHTTDEVLSNIKKVNDQTVQEDGSGFLEVKNESGNKIAEYTQVSGLLTTAIFKDSYNRVVKSRSAQGNPTQYEVGTGANKEIVNVVYSIISSVEKVASETKV